MFIEHNYNYGTMWMLTEQVMTWAGLNSLKIGNPVNTRRKPHVPQKGPRPLAQCRFRAVQCRRYSYNALRVFKWKCVHYSRVVPVKFIIVSSSLPEQAIVLH
jgi:hypothetical protein